MKRWIFLLLSVITVFFFGQTVGAEENIADTDELYYSLGIDESVLSSALPEEAEEVLSENDITIKNADRITDVTFSEVIGYILDKYKGKLAFPIRVFGIMLGITVISAGVKMFAESGADKYSARVYEAVSSAICAVLVCVPCVRVIDSIGKTVKAGGTFMLAYVPIYAGVAASSGAVTGAAVYNIAVITAADMASVFFSGVMLPLTSACMALGIADGAGPSVSLGGFTSVISKISAFLMIGVMTVFTGMLSLQSSIATSADSIAAKAAKLAVSNFVPVVGGALSDTYAAVRSGLILLKGCAGVYGIIAVSAILLPPVTESAALYIALSISSAAAEAAGLTGLSKLYKNTGSCVGMALGILLCFGALLIISTGILMSHSPAY